MKNAPILPLAALAIVLALTGCGSSQPVGLTEREHRVEFDTVTDSTLVDRGEAGLTALDVFLATNGARYGDRLVVSADADTLETLRVRYATTGLRVLSAPGEISTPDAPIRATFVRLLVTPPACGDWSDGEKVGGDNRPASNWGCASTSNLARMVADPNDLIAGRAPPPEYNTQADSIAVRAYRAKTIEWELAPGGTTGG